AQSDCHRGRGRHAADPDGHSPPFDQARTGRRRGAGAPDRTPRYRCRPLLLIDLPPSSLMFALMSALMSAVSGHRLVRVCFPCPAGPVMVVFTPMGSYSGAV